MKAEGACMYLEGNRNYLPVARLARQQMKGKRNYMRN